MILSSVKIMARLKPKSITTNQRKKLENSSNAEVILNSSGNTRQSRRLLNRRKQLISPKKNETALLDQCASNKNIDLDSISNSAKPQDQKLRKCVARLKRVAIPKTSEVGVDATSKKGIPEEKVVQTQKRTSRRVCQARLMRTSVRTANLGLLQRSVTSKEKLDEGETAGLSTKTNSAKEENNTTQRSSGNNQSLPPDVQTPRLRQCYVKIAKIPVQKAHLKSIQQRVVSEENMNEERRSTHSTATTSTNPVKKKNKRTSASPAKYKPPPPPDIETPKVRQCHVRIAKIPKRQGDSESLQRSVTSKHKKIEEENSTHSTTKTHSRKKQVTKKSTVKQQSPPPPVTPRLRRCHVKIAKISKRQGESRVTSKQKKNEEEKSEHSTTTTATNSPEKQSIKNKNDKDKTDLFKCPEVLTKKGKSQLSKSRTKEALLKCGPISSTPIAESKTRDYNDNHNSVIYGNSNNFVNSLIDLEEFESVLSKKERSAMKKLSLSKKGFDTSKSLEMTRGNEFSRFEPARNSTAYEQPPLRGKRTKRLEKINEATTEVATKEKVIKLKNKLDRVALNYIENTNIFEEDDDVISVQEADTNKPKSDAPANKTCKFFHRNLDKNTKEQKINKVTTTPGDLGGRRKRATKKNSIEPDNVYEFLSQSQSSGSDTKKEKDPAADIIKKLIEEGKVTVATKAKGKGKPVIKPKKRQPRKNNKQGKKVNFKEINKKPTAEVAATEGDCIHFEEGPISPPANDDYLEDVVPTEPAPNVTHWDGEENINSIAITPPSTPSTPARQEKQMDKFGGDKFSHLARTVLLQETDKDERQQRDLEERRRLLKFARNFVNKTERTKSSTKSSSNHLLQTPCRVSEDAYLPKEFSFRINNSSLPSFSSDFYPASPKKNKSKNVNQTTGVNKDCTNAVFDVDDDLGVTPIITNELDEPADSTDATLMHNTCELDQVSDMPAFADTRNDADIHPTNETGKSHSATSNDSNMENMPPPKPAGENQNETDANADIFNLRQLPNPRRTLPNRSPLKNINILEVVIIPAPSAHNKLLNLETQDQNELSQAENEEIEPSENVTEIEDNGKAESTNEFDNNQDYNVCEDIESEYDTTSNTKASGNDLFGFEEFLDDDTNTKHLDSSDNVKKPRRPNIKKKLQKLRKLRPAEHELTISKPTQATPTVFDECNRVTRQRTVKEMLCSTMVNPQKRVNLNFKGDLADDDDDDDDDSVTGNNKEANKAPNLFEDFEPELIFDQKKPRRTYSRQPLKKRKTNHHFILFSSDDSSEEEDREHEKKQQKKRAKKREDYKDKKEMDSFVDEFNEMCKEVDSYDMIIE